MFLLIQLTFDLWTAKCLQENFGFSPKISHHTIFAGVKVVCVDVIN